ncbi:class I SAM-dependent methyltransferase [Aurantivibrio infirmus]
MSTDEDLSQNCMKTVDANPVLQKWDGFLKETDFSAAYDSRRIFHGRGGCFQGLEWCCVDVFAPVLLITLFKAPPDDFLEDVLTKIVQGLPTAKLTSIALQRRYLSKSPIEFVVGECPEQVFALRKGLRFCLNFNRQNVGFFLDMEPGRRWLEENARGKTVLNLFSYTCAFSVVAKSVDALSVVNVDMSSSALSTGRDNHRSNQQDTGNIKFLALDILKSWSRIRKHSPYDIIVIDPPSYQKGSFVAEKDYVKLIKKIPQLARQGTQILACLNSPELAEKSLKELFCNNVPECEFLVRLENSEDFPDVSGDNYLKLLCYRYSPVS